MPQPVTYNPGTPVSGSIQENSISYVVDGQNRNYRGGFGGLSWMSEVPAANNVIFIGNSVSLGRGPANIPLFYPSYNNSVANIIYAANTLPGSPRNFTTTGSAYNWAVTNNFFINNSDNPIPRIDADSMFLCLDAEQATSFPQTGTSWYDMSGANYTVTGTNNPTWNYNNGRSYWQFDGTDDYFAFSSTPPIAQSTYTSTVEIWAKSINNVPSFQVMFGGGVQNTNQGYYYGFRQNNGNFMYAFYGNDQDGATPRDNRVWNHYVAVYNQSTGARYRYFNGELLSPSQASGVTATSANSFTIGAFKDVNTGPQYFYNGYISKVRGYSKELTQAEIKQNYFQSNIVQDGLVFMVDANNIVSYEGSGTSTYSLTGSNVATLFNGVGYNSLNGGSWTFDGVDDYISSTVTGLPTGASARTVNIWVKITGTTGNPYYALCGYGSPNISQTFDLGFNDTTDKVFLDIYGAGGITSANSITKDEWHMITGIYTGAQLQLYIDGVLEATNNYVINTANSSFEISDTAWGYPAPLVGNVSNAQIYNRALTASEVQQNYQATKDKFLGQNIVTSGLVLNLDAANKDSYPGTGTTWNNTVSNSYNGTLNNGPSFLSNINGGVIAFDGVDDEVTGPKPTFSAVTLEYYCKLTGNSTGGYPHIVMSGNTFIGFIGNTSLARFRIAINPGAGYSEITSDLLNPSTNFNLYSMTYDGTTVRMYVNGVLQSNTMNIPPTFSLMDGNAYYLNATTTPSYDKAPNQIPIFRLYNRALSTTEVLQNYNAQKIRFGL